MSVSANTLFHFTQFDTLKSIIKTSGFWAKYSLENFYTSIPKSSDYNCTYIPMVCFCDLKLTQLSNTSISKHTKYFGGYGIGFNKTWGIKNNISPVSYIHNNSIAFSTISGIISQINTDNNDYSEQLIIELGEVVKFLKPYQGYHQKGKKKSGLITYYDEREWRYIPKSKGIKHFPKTLNHLSI